MLLLERRTLRWTPKVEQDESETAAAGFRSAGSISRHHVSKDSALAITVGAGASNTVIVNGVGAASGEAMVEVYELP